MNVFSGCSLAPLGDLSASEGRITTASVSRDELIPRLGEADVLLLPHGFTGRLSAEEYSTIFPTKTIEYLVSGRPILPHAPESSFISRFLRERDGAWVVSEPDGQALRDAIMHLRGDAARRASLVRNALAAAKQFEAKTVAAHLTEILWNAGGC